MSMTIHGIRLVDGDNRPWAIDLASPPLGTNERGLVISTPLRFEEVGAKITAEQIVDPQELRSALLFWDRFDFPDFGNPLLQLHGGPDVQFLQAEGLLKRSQVSGGEGPYGSQVLKSFVGTFQKLDQRDPGRWSLARGERSLSFQEVDLTPAKGFLLELIQAIPVPNEDVPLDDILEFKRKRTPELLALRARLDEIYQSVVNSKDGPHAEAAALGKLDRTLTDLLEVSGGSGFTMKLMSLEAKVECDWVKIGGFAGAAYLGTLSLTAAALAAGTSLISIKSSAGLKREQASRTPYEYVTRFHKDLFLRRS